MAATSSGRGRGRRAMNDINVVPYIDVMLVLLVIFMVTAPMMTPGVLDLPTVAKANLAQQEPPLEIDLKANGTVTLRDMKTGVEQKLDIAAVPDAVKAKLAAGGERAVVIAGDKSIKYERVMQVMDGLQRAAIPRVGLLVKPSR
ncbi:MAG: protein TolR [Burkholderiaceae bacterium]